MGIAMILGPISAAQTEMLYNDNDLSIDSIDQTIVQSRSIGLQLRWQWDPIDGTDGQSNQLVERSTCLPMLAVCL